MEEFIPNGLVVQKPEDISVFFQELLERELNSAEEFQVFLKHVSDLESFVSEDMAWRYIRMTCDTKSKDHEEAYLKFVQEIQPVLAPLEDKLNNKIVGSEFTASLESDAAYFIYLRGLKSAVKLFREENVAIQSELATLAQEYSGIQGKMSIDWKGEEITLQKASNILMKTDSEERKEAWSKIQERRNQDVEKLDDIFDQMVSKRHQLALNAGFNNYRDYMFESLGRYDYSAQDCKEFHEAIEKEVVPLLKKVHQRRKALMGVDSLKPWDTQVDPLNRAPLSPFKGGAELLDKGIKVLEKLDPFFGECLLTMKSKGLLDLDSRVGKAPGGYNYPLAKTNMPFIFMNATENLRDVETLLHEAGHAIHSFKMAPLELNGFKDTPSEVAELASMSMELMSMAEWDVYFEGKEELQRAKVEQLEGVISTLPWIATIDAFQHWIYENPTHSREERKVYWKSLLKRFGTGEIDYSEYEDALEYSWQRQLHLFEVPFYYIEYGIAQLGAVGVWKNFLENKSKAIEGYKSFMGLGYTKSIPDIFKSAGIQFDFSTNYVAELMQFVGELYQIETSK